MTDEIQVNGECHCGKIEIKATVKLSEVRACHCTDCQQMSGAPLRAIAVAPADKIKIKGIPKEYINDEVLIKNLENGKQWKVSLKNLIPELKNLEANK